MAGRGDKGDTDWPQLEGDPDESHGGPGGADEGRYAAQADCLGAPAGSQAALIGLGAGIGAFGLFLIAGVFALYTQIYALALVLLLLAIGLSFAAMWWGYHAWAYIMVPGVTMAWKGAVIAAMLVGVVFVGGFVVLPLLGLLIGLLCCCSPSGCDPGCEGCGDCGCEGCGDCCGDCGDCGDCGGGCDCGDCGCLTLATTAHTARASRQHRPVSLRKAINNAWNHRRRLFAAWLSHHPDTPMYKEDVYRMGRHRLCIGCFTTYPVFLLGVATLLYLPVPGTWVAWVLGGILLASLQAVSSAGLARRRWSKAGVKAALGLGLAMTVVGVLVSSLPPFVQLVALIGLLVVAALSAVPRTIRMRRDQAASR